MVSESISWVKVLMQATRVEELASLADQTVGGRWLPLGGRANNSGSVNLAIESGQALVERITNAIDAHIELRYELAGRPDGLASPRDAVRRLWDIRPQRLTREDATTARLIEELAPGTVLRAVGSADRGQSTVVIEDRGIGQYPDDFASTLLSIGESNKVNRPYLMGAFGQGGSSAFAFCPLSLIISRRYIDCLDGRPDMIGWTIVRKYDDDSLKTYRYEYLVDADGRVPTLTPRDLEQAGVDFPHGTKIVHAGFDLGRLNQRWSLVGYRYFDNLLFDPILPYRLEDHRFAQHFNRNMNGARNRLDVVAAAKRPEAQDYQVDLSRWGGEGTVNIRCWVFKPGPDDPSDPEDVAGVKLDSYLDYDGSNRTILFSVDGQRHHARDKSLIREARLGALADYVLLHVDCDGLTRRLKKEIFIATRAGATTGERREDLLLHAVREALADPWLRDKLREVVRRRESELARRTTERVREMLNRLIAIYRVETRVGGQRARARSGSSRTGRQRESVDPPRTLRFADHERLELRPGTSTTVWLITDGPDDLLTRQRRQGRLEIEVEGDDVFSASHGSVEAGRIPVHVGAHADAATGRRVRLVARLSVEPDTFLSDSREAQTVPEPEPYRGTEPPTRFAFSDASAWRIESGRSGTAGIDTDARDDLLSRAVDPAVLSVTTTLDGLNTAVRGPREGHVQLEAFADAVIPVGSTGEITATLTLADGSSLSTTRPCEVIEARRRAPGAGQRETPVPAYDVIEVWREPPPGDAEAHTWSNSHINSWSEDKPGHWEPNGDQLALYVNMDHGLFRSERTRWARRFGDAFSSRLMIRYVAYLAFHMYQMHETVVRDDASSASGGGSEGEGWAGADPDSPEAANELRRVVSTLVQTLRSEAELQSRDDNEDAAADA